MTPDLETLRIGPAVASEVAADRFAVVAARLTGCCWAVMRLSNGSYFALRAALVPDHLRHEVRALIT